MPAQTSTAAPSPAFIELFRARTDANGQMRFDQFMALALYDPRLGYYRQPRRRTGCGAGTDFFTSSTSGPVFGELVCAAAQTLLAEKGGRAADYVFVEIGAEPDGGGVLAGARHPFGGARTIRAGEAIALDGNCVVFSNELFDAQPFRRFVFRDGAWRELGVALEGRELREVVLPDAPADDEAARVLPPDAPEGWHLDLPFASVALAREIAAQPWRGLFLACDYGKSWRELIEAAPAGTARAYHRHTQTNDLLARPGEQDLTCHVCWDWLAGALARGNFTSVNVESQEAFFMRHAAGYLAPAIADTANSARRRSLAQLLHPAHLGRSFQALRGRRDDSR